MTLSVIIPTWSGTEDLFQMARDLCKQVRPMCDELIIAEDSKYFYDEFLELADTYVCHKNWGDIVNCVRALPLATGNYVATINSDVIIERGNIRDLCIPGYVVSPQWKQLREFRSFQGPFFVVPREIIEQYGYLDSAKQGGGADYHYADKIKDVFMWSDAVEYTHLAGRSYSAKRRIYDEEERSRKEELRQNS
jgi:hypothetical protein